MNGPKKGEDNKLLDELNKEVHQLNYIEIGKAAEDSAQLDVKRAKEIAKQLRENIEAYRNETGLSQRPHPQT